jgi:hypothetical protein
VKRSTAINHMVIFILLLQTIKINAAEPVIPAPKENVVDFDSIKNVLKNDQLDTIVKKKVAKQKKREEAKLAKEKMRFDIPTEDQFWSFFSEYWLVKNAPLLKWEFKRPSYGLGKSLEVFFEKMGIYEQKFKIILANTPNIFHFALPSNNNEVIFILSLPFVRILDLSKLEISLLLFEDYLRAKNGLFISKIKTKKLTDLLGSNFYEKKIDQNIFKEVLKKYDQLVYDKGFNYQEQFEVTKQMNNFLKNDMKLWNVYYQMIIKIDDLVKGNVLYRSYIKIYPSPELQLGWLSPKKRN